MEPVKVEFRGDMTYRLEYADGSVRWVGLNDPGYSELWEKYGPNDYPPQEPLA